MIYRIMQGEISRIPYIEEWEEEDFKNREPENELIYYETTNRAKMLKIFASLKED